MDGDPGKCRKVGEAGQPLVVDWPAHERVNLEEAMMQGVAVVSYSCEGLKLLADCKIAGSYGFMGLTQREEVVQLVDADEIRANLPGFGVALVADIGAELRRGSSLDLAMVLAGKSKTTVPRATRAELTGSCQGATHFVRGAFIGAFAMSKGTRGSVGTTAKIFGSGAEAKSESERRAKSREGDPKACASVQPGDSKPPTGCRSAIRLELVALSEVKESTAGSSPIDELKEATACPEGMVRSGAKCTPPAPEKAYACSGTDATECQTQCSKGNVESCFFLGSMYETGRGAQQDFAKAASHYQSTCDRGLAEGCNRLGVMHFYGSGATKDAERAVKLFALSCKTGLADACNNLGFVLDVGRGVARDSAKAAILFEAACNGGDVPGCFNAGVLHVAGRGVAKSESKAAAFFERARQGGVVERYRSGCEYGNAYSCFGLGYMHQRGLMLPKDETLAKKYLERSCPGVEWGCEALGRPPGG